MADHKKPGLMFLFVEEMLRVDSVIQEAGLMQSYFSRVMTL